MKLTKVIPKLPMRDKSTTMAFYIQALGFVAVGVEEYEGYLMIQKDDLEIHFFEYKELIPTENYGQLYIRTLDIDHLYQSLIHQKIKIHPNGHLQIKQWKQKEFSLLDPDNNLLTFGEAI